LNFERWSDKRLVELASQNSNVAGAVAAMKELHVRRDLGRSAHAVSNQEARELLLKMIERSRAGRETCPTCGRGF
jgi:hypothetical protein